MTILRRLLSQLIELILPKDALVKKLEKMTPEDFLVTTTQSPLALFSYKNPIVRRALWEIKFRNNRIILKIVAKAVADRLLPTLSDLEIFCKNKKIILIPIPLSQKRRRERGYNQTAELAKEIIKALYKIHQVSNIELNENIIKRVLHSEPQTKVRSRQRRLRNLQNAYQVEKPEIILDQIIILLDDITTTGATMTAAANVIIPHNPRQLICIAIAH